MSNESYKLKNTVPQTVFHNLPTFVGKLLGTGGGGGVWFLSSFPKHGLYYHASLI